MPARTLAPAGHDGSSCSPLPSKITARTRVAVGTAPTSGPPHKSQRAGLPHWAPALGVWRSAPPGMGAGCGLGAATGWRGGSSWPRRANCAGYGTAAPDASAVQPGYGRRSPRRCCRARHSRPGARVPRWPAISLLGDGQVLASLELGLHPGKLGPHPFRVSLPPDPEPPGLRGRADVHEPQKGERFRFPGTPGCPVAVGMPPELNQPGLVRVQFQPELREPAAKLSEEPPTAGPPSRTAGLRARHPMDRPRSATAGVLRPSPGARSSRVGMGRGRGCRD